MEAAAESERSPVVDESDFRIWDSLIDLNAHIHPLHGCGDGVIVGSDVLLPVLGKELKEVAHVDESHVELERLLGDDSVLAGDFCCHIPISSTLTGSSSIASGHPCPKV